jgi:DNA processing protein
MPPSPLLDWIAVGLLPGLGSVRARRALERYGDPHTVAFRAPARELRGLLRMPEDAAAAIAAARRTLARDAEREWKLARKLGLSLLTCEDPGYPAELAEIPDAPVLLYLRGSLPAGVLRIGVVGSRRPTYYGKKIATGVGAGIAARGVEVVSGGARGIDACAHTGALEEGGRTVAVLGSGLARPYPEEHEPLFERIARQGAVLSEFPLETAPHAENFPRRNRLISGLSAALVVVEAGRKSGTLITAGHALEQGREVLAIPGPVDSPRSAGCHHLIQQGAKLVQNVEDIFEELSPIYRGAVGAEPPPPGLGGPPAGLLPDEAALLDLLHETQPVQLDALAEQAPFGFARVQTALFGLELRGAIETLPGRHYARKGRGRGPAG